MKRMTHTMRLAAVASATMLVLAACGSEDSSSDTDTDASTAASATAATIRFAATWIGPTAADPVPKQPHEALPLERRASRKANPANPM